MVIFSTNVENIFLLYEPSSNEERGVFDCFAESWQVSNTEEIFRLFQLMLWH